MEFICILIGVPDQMVSWNK